MPGKIILMKSIFRIHLIIVLSLVLFSCSNVDQSNTPVYVSTKPISEILYTSAVSGGIIESDQNSGVAARGVCWDVNPDPTIDMSVTVDGIGSGEYESAITGLAPGETYFVRAYATTGTGTEYGENLSFTTHLTGVKFNSDLVYGTVSDIEGNNYKTIPIGPLVWMAQNLKTTKFSDGSGIPLVKENFNWSNILTPGYCWFNNNDSMYADIYGAYYNWFAVSTGKLCPAGWHVPSDSEWESMVSYLGGDRVAGSKLKEAGANNWVGPNRDATNQSGFTGLPGGMREAIYGTFGGQGNFGGWWSSTELTTSELGTAYYRWIHGDTTVVVRNGIFKKDGFTVRCVKD